MLVFRLAAMALVWAARRGGRPRYPSLRLALANLYRPGAPTAAVVASLGLGLAVLVAIALVEGNVAEEIDMRLPERAPSFFFIDIQPDQVAAFDALLQGMPGVVEEGRVPSLRGRITRINGVPVEQGTRRVRRALGDPGRARPHLRRGPAARARASSPARGGRRIIMARRSCPSMPISRAAWGSKLGDTLTVNVLGRELTARITNLREIDWTSLGINFAIVLSPGALDGAPQTNIATARTAPENEAALERAVTDRFPNVSAIAVKDALQALGDIVRAIARGGHRGGGGGAGGRGAGAGGRDRGRPSPPRLRCRGAQGAGGDAPRRHLVLPYRVRTHGAGSRGGSPPPSARSPPGCC